MERYKRNITTLSKEENEKLKDVKVCVVGCGGLGGYIIEMLGRIGIGKIIAVDGDVFEESNLNRQILSDVDSLGSSKALKACQRMKSVNPLIEVIPVSHRLTQDNCHEIIRDSIILIDALDNIPSRLIMQKAAEDLGIPLVHGAIAGWYGQVTTILPGDRTLSMIYSDTKSNGMEKDLGNPSFTPALIASIQVSEVIKLIIGRGDLLRNKLLLINLLDNEYEIIEI